MNVILLNDAAYVRGGADRVAFASAAELARRGHHVVLVTGFGPLDPGVNFPPGVETVTLGAGWIRESANPVLLSRAIWNAPAARRLGEILRGFDPADTVVHAHLYSSALSASVLHRSLRQQFPTVLTLHDYFITCPNGAHFEFPSGRFCERVPLSFSCLRCHCDSRRRVHKIWRAARTAVQNGVAGIPSRLTAYVAVSETCAAVARRHLPPDARVEVIANPVLVERRPPVPAKENRAFVFSGRLESYKGPQLFAAAAARLGLPAVFCGAGPLERELRRSCPGATFTGWLAAADLEAQLDRARAFVFPSLFRETFGLAAVEALARGLPVVASRGTAAEEFVVDGENGLLFAHHSVDDLARCLAALSEDQRVARLGAEAYRRYWQAPLTASRHAERLVALYEDLLGSARAREAAARRVA